MTLTEFKLQHWEKQNESGTTMTYTSIKSGTAFIIKIIQILKKWYNNCRTCRIGSVGHVISIEMVEIEGFYYNKRDIPYSTHSTSLHNQYALYKLLARFAY